MKRSEYFRPSTVVGTALRLAEDGVMATVRGVGRVATKVASAVRAAHREAKIELRARQLVEGDADSDRIAIAMRAMQIKRERSARERAQ